MTIEVINTTNDIMKKTSHIGTINDFLNSKISVRIILFSGLVFSIIGIIIILLIVDNVGESINCFFDNVKSNFKNNMDSKNSINNKKD